MITNKSKLKQEYKSKISDEKYKINQSKANIKFYKNKLKELTKKKTLNNGKTKT